VSTDAVVIIDYGMGNLWSVLSATRYLGCTAVVSGDPEAVRAARRIILPGVGSFRKAMSALTSSGLSEAILEAVNAREASILGICLGMQLLGRCGSEDGDTAGLGLVPANVDRFAATELGARKIPHVGFNSIHFSQRDGLFSGLPQDAEFEQRCATMASTFLPRSTSATCLVSNSTRKKARPTG
jgi:imidazole glycerol-phosphate synthase subunit HisH